LSDVLKHPKARQDGITTKNMKKSKETTLVSCRERNTHIREIAICNRDIKKRALDTKSVNM